MGSLLREAAEQGDAAAECARGAQYATGDGVPQDVEQAVRWWQRAAEQGHVAAALNVAAAYRAGVGVPGRRVAVEASATGRDLGGVAADIQQTLQRDLQLPQGYFFNVGGRVESQARASRSLMTAIALALFAVVLLLYFALDSFTEAAVILVTIPVAFVGGIAGLLLAGETWNVSSLVGLIGLFGIAVQNSLVLVTQTRGLCAEGRDLPDAVREASLGRVRPKLMTAATAILGLLPLLVLRLHGTEIERPLAIVMIGGLVTSTLFTLLVLPALYLMAKGASSRRLPEGSV